MRAGRDGQRATDPQIERRDVSGGKIGIGHGQSGTGRHRQVPGHLDRLGHERRALAEGERSDLDPVDRPASLAERQRGEPVGEPPLAKRTAEPVRRVQECLEAAARELADRELGPVGDLEPRRRVQHDPIPAERHRRPAPDREPVEHLHADQVSADGVLRHALAAHDQVMIVALDDLEQRRGVVARVQRDRQPDRPGRLRGRPHRCVADRDPVVTGAAVRRDGVAAVAVDEVRRAGGPAGGSDQVPARLELDRAAAARRVGVQVGDVVVRPEIAVVAVHGDVPLPLALERPDERAGALELERVVADRSALVRRRQHALDLDADVLARDAPQIGTGRLDRADPVASDVTHDRGALAARPPAVVDDERAAGPVARAFERRARTGAVGRCVARRAGARFGAPGIGAVVRKEAHPPPGPGMVARARAAVGAHEPGGRAGNPVCLDEHAPAGAGS